MSIIERMFSIMTEKGLKSKELAEKLNINPSVISTWKSKNRNPPSEYINCICEFLGISSNYLLTGEPERIFETSEQEQQIIMMWRALNDENKEDLWDNLTLKYQRQTGRKGEYEFYISDAARRVLDSKQDKDSGAALA